MELARVIASTTIVVLGEDSRDRIRWSAAWAAAISAKSITGGAPVRRALASIRERASATTFSEPLMWRIVEVNWEM